MPALLIADVDITDRVGYDDYLSQLPQMMAAYGGKYLVRGAPAQVLEGSWQPRRLAILEFPSMEQLLAFYDSAEYAPVKAGRMNSCDANIVVVQTV